MRGKRSKQYRKLMQQYNLTFGFREPYQVLIDVQMLLDTERFKMDLVAGLERTLHGHVKPMITQCTIRHLFLLPTITTTTTTPSNPTSIPSPIPPQTKTALLALARTFERRRCNHHTLANPLSTLACLADVVDPKASGANKNRYVLASQDEAVRRWARGVRGVPSVYVRRSVMVMEPMSEGSAGVREGMERGKLRGGVRGMGVGVGEEGGGGKRKREDAEEIGDVGGEGAKKRRVRGPKGPNPLSVRKAKRRGEGDGTDAGREGGDGDGVVGERPGKAGETRAGRADLVTDGEDVRDSAGHTNTTKRTRKRKHKSGTTATVQDAATQGDAIID